MHTLVLESLQNQQQEIQELRELLALTSGQAYQRPEKEQLPDVYASHPRGKERFETNDHINRYQKGVHHNQLTAAVREKMLTGEAKEPGQK